MKRRKRLKRLERPRRYRFTANKSRPRITRLKKQPHPLGTLLIWEVLEIKED
jgi:hypothetical protein